MNDFLPAQLRFMISFVHDHDFLFPSGHLSGKVV